MTAETTPKTPLDGLLRCGICGAPMRYEEASGAHEARYFCNQEHWTGTEAALQARTTDHLVISGVLAAIFTEKNIGALQYAIREPQDQGNSASDFPTEDIGLLREHIAFFLRATGRAERTRNFLTTFITRIELFPDRAVVSYAMPLPSDSHLAGATEQEVLLSADGIH